MQWFIQNAQILIIGFVILSSILGPVFKWLGEKRQQLKAENERKKRELDELRTGRVEQQGPTPEELEQMIAEQVAAQRAEMLRQRAEQAEARRRAAQERAEQAKRKRQEATVQSSGQAGGQRSEQARKQSGGQSIRPQRTKPVKGVKAPQTYEQASKLSTPPMIPIEAMGAQMHAHPSARAVTRAPSAAVVGRLGPNELRRAVVLTEILGKPIALRDSEGHI